MSIYGNLPVPTPEGYFVNETHRRVAEIIADYDPHLRLAFIPYSQRDPNDPLEKPFAVIDTRPTLGPHFVMFADESEISDGSLLARLFNNDLEKVDVGARLKAQQEAQEIMRLKEQIEAQEQIEDITRTLRRRSFS
jgi:hypothetical protein